MLRGVNEFSIDIAKSFVIGDRYSDFNWYMTQELGQFLYCLAIAMENMNTFETIEKYSWNGLWKIFYFL